MKTNILSKDFSMKETLKFTLPSVFMMLFMSTYTIVDGLFVANLVGEKALSAVNFVFPIFGIVMAIALMLSIGANAIIGKYMGEGNIEKARKFLSAIYIIGVSFGIILTIFIYIFPNIILDIIGVNDSLYQLSKDYLLSISMFIPIFILQIFAQTLLVTAGKPDLGLFICVVGGVTNMVLDYIFISPKFLNLGISGAGYATGVGSSIPGIFGLIYFIYRGKKDLYFEKAKFKLKEILDTISNGSSELIGSLSISITTILFNATLLKMVGESGVAAMSVILYIQQIQTAIYFGYTMGVAPIIAYKYGEKNRKALEKIVRQSFIFTAITSALIVLFSILFYEEATLLFISRESSTFGMTKRGLLLFTPAYIFMGFNVFFSAMFTALSNGKVSAILSILRTLILIIFTLLTLPKLIGLTGVWIAIPVAEFLAVIFGIKYFKKYKKTYGY